MWSQTTREAIVIKLKPATLKQPQLYKKTKANPNIVVYKSK